MIEPLAPGFALGVRTIFDPTVLAVEALAERTHIGPPPLAVESAQPTKVTSRKPRLWVAIVTFLCGTMVTPFIAKRPRPVMLLAIDADRRADIRKIKLVARRLRRPRRHRFRFRNARLAPARVALLLDLLLLGRRLRRDLLLRSRRAQQIFLPQRRVHLGLLARAFTRRGVTDRTNGILADTTPMDCGSCLVQFIAPFTNEIAVPIGHVNQRMADEAPSDRRGHWGILLGLARA